MVSQPPLPPPISAQLKYLLLHSPQLFRVDRIWSGCKNSRFSDRFTLLVPFCLDYVKWDIIYNAFFPFTAPDIVFSADDEGFSPLLPVIDGEGDAEVEARLKSSSMRDWSSKDPSRLFKLVHEIRVLFTHYQKKLVGEVDDARLKFEINTILSREVGSRDALLYTRKVPCRSSPQVSRRFRRPCVASGKLPRGSEAPRGFGRECRGIEVCLISGPDKPEEVKFAVPLLDVDLNKLVHACPWKQQQMIYLQVVYPISRRYSSAPSPRVKLVPSSQLKDLISVEDVKLPSWVDGMCMAEYLPSLEDALNIQIMEAVASIGARRRFIEALVPKFGRPIEADPIFCRRATFLAINGVFTFLVHLSLSTQFPKQQPLLTLQSSQHYNSQGTPILSPPLNDYPWSPRWNAPEMAERIFDFLVKECVNFKKYCLDAVAE